MTITKQANLVLKLYTKTDAGKLEWKRAVNDDAFQVSFSNYTVQLSTITRDPVIDYVITVLNSEGEIADSFTDVDISGVAGAPVKSKPRSGSESAPSWYQSMRTLYELARRSALGADKALDSLLSELDE